MCAIILGLGICSIILSSFTTVLASQSNSINSSISTSFGDNLKSKIKELITNSLNDTDNILNSSFISNASNQSSSNIIMSNSIVTSSIKSNDTDDRSSIIKDQVKTVNGVCSSTKVGGNANDTLASSGNCDDRLTGGLGADKFICGEGDDTIIDYNSKEGDIILDRQNCEKIL